MRLGNYTATSFTYNKQNTKIDQSFILDLVLLATVYVYREESKIIPIIEHITLSMIILHCSIMCPLKQTTET